MNSFTQSRLATGLVLTALAINALAAPVAATTDTVKGRAPSMLVPTITHGDTNSNGLVDTGDTLTAVPGTFTDLDGDSAIAPLHRWSDGSTNLGTTSTYTILAADLGKTINLYVTPRTDSTLTDPFSGTEQKSADLSVATAQTVSSVLITGTVGG